METAVAYIRVSSQKQVDGGSSLDTQEKQVRAYAEAKGYLLSRIFREEGESAKTDQRPVLQEMLEHCTKLDLATNVVIIPKIDRLARNVQDYTSLRVRLSKLKIRLESIGEKIEDSPVGRFTETLLASVAQFDNEIRSERSRGGMVEAVSQGRWVWPAPYGYRNVRVNGKGTIEPNPDEAPFVREAFYQLALGHQSAPIIWNRLRASGMPISRTRFYSMIENPVYQGKIVAFDGTFNAAPPFVPLVSEPVALRARRALRPSNNPQQYQVEREDFPIRGTALCRCGRLLTGYWARSKSGNRYAYYRCMSCPRTNYPKLLVEERFTDFLNGYDFDESEWQFLKTQLQELDVQVREQALTSRERREARRAELEQLAESITVKNANGVIPDDIASAQLRRISSELKEIKIRQDDQSEPHEVSSLVDFAANFLGRIGGYWSRLSLVFKKDLLRFMFPQGVLFDPNTGFRTPGNSLLERVKAEIGDVVSCLVDRDVEFSNTVTREFKALREIVDRYQGELTEIERSGSDTGPTLAQPQAVATAAGRSSRPVRRSTSRIPDTRSVNRTDSERTRASRIGSCGEPIRRSSRGGASDTATR